MCLCYSQNFECTIKNMKVIYPRKIIAYDSYSFFKRQEISFSNSLHTILCHNFFLCFPCPFQESNYSFVLSITPFVMFYKNRKWDYAIYYITHEQRTVKALFNFVILILQKKKCHFNSQYFKFCHFGHLNWNLLTFWSNTCHMTRKKFVILVFQIEKLLNFFR